MSLLNALGACEARLRSLYFQLRRSEHVSSVTRSFEIVGYIDGASVEGYVDAELHQGDAICWWFELKRNLQQWEILTSVLVNNKNGDSQVEILEFPIRKTSDFDQLLAHLKDACGELVGSASRVDLGASPPSFLDTD